MKVSNSIMTVVVFVMMQAGFVHALLVGDTINIVLGTDVVRTFADVQTDGYVYGPKQVYDAVNKTTKIYMPYGSTNGVYELEVVSFFYSAPTNAPTLAASSVGTVSAFLTYKMHFNAPISWFNYNDNYAIFSGAVGTSLVGEYSTDGSNWHNLVTIAGTGGNYYLNSGMFGASGASVDGLNTQDLYIRIKTVGNAGIQHYMQLRQVGAGIWGEADFFRNQHQLTVKAAPLGTVIVIK